MRKGGGGGEGKFLRADSKGKKGQEKRTLPTLAFRLWKIWKIKDRVSRKINGNHIQIIAETYT